MQAFTRRGFGGVFAGLGLAFGMGPAQAQAAELTLYTAGQGSAFLPYGQGLARYLAASANVSVRVAESKGSVENAGKIEDSASALGTVFLGTAYEAANGLAWASGRKHASCGLSRRCMKLPSRLPSPAARPSAM